MDKKKRGRKKRYIYIKALKVRKPFIWHVAKRVKNFVVEIKISLKND